MSTASALVLRARSTGSLALLDEAEAIARDGYEWCAIAETFVAPQLAGARGEPLRDRAAYCLSRALVDAGTDVRIYRNVARIHRRMENAPAGAKALAAAAAVFLAEPDTSSTTWCLLADAWHAQGDRDAALDYLRHALASARTASDHCEVAERSFDIAGGGEIAAAARLARTSRDHVLIAKAADYVQDLDGHLDQVQRAIDRVEDDEDAIYVLRALERFDAPDEQRALLAARETRRTNATESTAMAPAVMLPDGARSLGWPHAPSELFDELRRTIPRAQVEYIAAADYGMDYPAHLAALDAMIETGEIATPMPWEPGEVLALTRWSEGDDVNHLARAFACCVLCIDDAGPHSRSEGHEASLVALLESCIALGTSAVDGAIGLFAAMANAYRDPAMRAFAELALIFAAAWRDAGDPRIAPVVLRLVHEEPKLRETAVIVADGWLLGITNFDQRHFLWRQLARILLVDPSPHLVRLAALLRND